MNKQYILLDDAAYVTNENGEIKETKKTNNLEEKLTIENELEQVEDEINAVTKKLKDKKAERKSAFNYCKLTYLMGLLALIVFPMYMNGLIMGGISLAALFGPELGWVTVATLASVTSTTSLLSLMFLGKSPSKKVIKGLEKRIELLEKLKSKVLKELENIKKQEKEIAEPEKEGLDQVHFIPTNSRKEEMELIRVYSTYLKKFNKLYQKNKLEKFLSRLDYTDFQIKYMNSLIQNELINENKYVDDSEVKSTKRSLKKERKTTKK